MDTEKSKFSLEEIVIYFFRSRCEKSIKEFELLLENKEFNQKIRTELNIREDAEEYEILDYLHDNIKYISIAITTEREKDVIVSRANDSSIEIIIKLPPQSRKAASIHLTSRCSPGDIDCIEKEG